MNETKEVTCLSSPFHSRLSPERRTWGVSGSDEMEWKGKWWKTWSEPKWVTNGGSGHRNEDYLMSAASQRSVTQLDSRKSYIHNPPLISSHILSSSLLSLRSSLLTFLTPSVVRHSRREPKGVGRGCRETRLTPRPDRTWEGRVKAWGVSLTVHPHPNPHLATFTLSPCLLPSPSFRSARRAPLRGENERGMGS